MNVNDPKVPPATPQSQTSGETNASTGPGTRVEPCEFESLLRRAMEILDTRARAATTSSTT
jgi:hypothetical protein